MDYAQFIKSVKSRNRLVYAWLALTGILVFAAIIFIVLQQNTTARWPFALVSICMTGVLVESIILLLLSSKEKRRNYALFQSETIIINKDTTEKLRKTEQFAIAQCEGNLKLALQHIATSPDLTRAERMDYIMEWHDYEKDFIGQRYGAEPHRIAKSSRKLPLPTDGNTYTRAVCVKKYTHLSYDDSSVEYLDFGSHGKYEATEHCLYRLTEPGDEFYLLTSLDGKKINKAYSLLDWELIE